MPRQNRVTPLGELIATPARGLVYGNRGCLHDADGRIRRHHATTRWIACRLDFNDRRRAPLMAPGRFTELFFLDEATALAAGHRPCGECRYADYQHFKTVWAELHPGRPSADTIDTQLQAERLLPVARNGIPSSRPALPRARRQPRRRFHEAALDDLPDGVFVLVDGAPHLVLGGALLTWSPAGYTARRRRPTNVIATMITPPSLVALLRTERTPLVPFLHESAAAMT
jgi:hypothetical protein